MKRFTKPLIYIAVFFALLALIPLAFPYSLLQKDFEKQIGQIVHGKVQIGGIHFSYTPNPMLILDRVRIDDGKEAVIDRIILPVNMRNIVSRGKNLHGTELDGVNLSRQFALGLPARFNEDSSKITRLGEVKLTNTFIKLEKTTLGPLQGSLNFLPSGSIENALIHSPDARLQLEIKPAESETFNVLFSAKDWKLPFGHPLEFDYISIIGKANSAGMLLTDIRAGIYNGSLKGSGQLVWVNGWKLSGELTARNMHALRLVTLFSPVTHVTGILNGEGRFEYEAESHLQIFDNPKLSGRFSVTDGTLHNVDLISSLKYASGSSVSSGGQTNFNTFSGHISVQKEGVNLSHLRLQSGKLHANGELFIRNGKISGGAASTLSAGGITASNQVDISGTLNALELRSGGAWRPRSDDNAVIQVTQ